MKKSRRIIEHTKKIIRQYFFQILALSKNNFNTLAEPNFSGENLVDLFESCGFEEIVSMREPDLNEPDNPKKYKAYFIVPVGSKIDLTKLYSLISNSSTLTRQRKKSLSCENTLLKTLHDFQAEDCNYSLIVVSVDKEHNTSSLITIFPALTSLPCKTTI